MPVVTHLGPHGEGGFEAGESRHIAQAGDDDVADSGRAEAFGGGGQKIGLNLCRLALAAFADIEHDTQRGHGRHAGGDEQRQFERTRRAAFGRQKATQHGAYDKAEREGRADHAEPTGALFRRRDVGNIALHGRDIA